MRCPSSKRDAAARLRTGQEALEALLRGSGRVSDEWQQRGSGVRCRERAQRWQRQVAARHGAGGVPGGDVPAQAVDDEQHGFAHGRVKPAAGGVRVGGGAWRTRRRQVRRVAAAAHAGQLHARQQKAARKER